MAARLADGQWPRHGGLGACHGVSRAGRPMSPLGSFGMSGRPAPNARRARVLSPADACACGSPNLVLLICKSGTRFSFKSGTRFSLIPGNAAGAQRRIQVVAAGRWAGPVLLPPGRIEYGRGREGGGRTGTRGSSAGRPDPDAAADRRLAQASHPVPIRNPTGKGTECAAYRRWLPSRPGGSRSGLHSRAPSGPRHRYRPDRT